jgi:hypothetical protein
MSQKKLDKPVKARSVKRFTTVAQIAVLAVEPFVPQHVKRQEPHIDIEQHRPLQRVGQFSIEWQSTASSSSAALSFSVWPDSTSRQQFELLGRGIGVFNADNSWGLTP